MLYDPRWKEVDELNESGQPLSAIAQSYGVSSPTVRQWILRHRKIQLPSSNTIIWFSLISERAQRMIEPHISWSTKYDAYEMREFIKKNNVMEFDGIAEKTYIEILEAITLSLNDPPQDFSSVRADACIDYLAKWGYKVTPPDK